MTASLPVRFDVAAGEEPGVFLEQARVRNKDNIAGGFSLARGNRLNRFGSVLSPLAIGLS